MIIIINVIITIIRVAYIFYIPAAGNVLTALQKIIHYTPYKNCRYIIPLYRGENCLCGFQEQEMRKNLVGELSQEKHEFIRE